MIRLKNKVLGNKIMLLDERIEKFDTLEEAKEWLSGHIEIHKEYWKDGKIIPSANIYIMQDSYDITL